ncbi:MAG: GntR family transcriptional regulator [Actinomycetota bacterium]|nr:GntR family transcriptional regulator [Actinomycetota bacterium]
MYESLRVEHSSTVERVTEELRRALFEGELAPGTPLREVALADQIGVSRSTVREALSALVAEGLATRVPNRGVAVTALSADDVRDVLRARTALEVAGVRRWRSATPDQQEAVRRALDDFTETVRSGATPAQATAAHLDIHRALVGLTGSERLVSTAEALNAEIRLALAHVDRLRRNAREQVAAHRDLVTLLEDGRAGEAVRELERHLQGAEQSLLEAIAAR